jgi:hypothetical protein
MEVRSFTAVRGMMMVDEMRVTQKKLRNSQKNNGLPECNVATGKKNN